MDGDRGGSLDSTSMSQQLSSPGRSAGLLPHFLHHTGALGSHASVPVVGKDPSLLFSRCCLEQVFRYPVGNFQLPLKHHLLAKGGLRLHNSDGVLKAEKGLVPGLSPVLVTVLTRV